MNKKRNLILTILIAALVIGLLVWRLWPRSLEAISNQDFDQILDISLHYEDRSNGDTITSFSSILSPEDEAFDSVVSLLSHIRCRPSLANLNPLPADSLRFEGRNPLIISFVFKDGNQANLHLTERGEISADSTSLNGLGKYYITNIKDYETLLEYITTHRIENNS
ncbi:MAG: hypothetical protein J6A62_05620 [Oscillospiraceae bacterium]|nr:hypothetical protein [Oscillospiraceae bacterium]